MDRDRRSFLKTTSFAGAAAIAGASSLAVSVPAAAQTVPARTHEPRELPKGMTFATLARPGGHGLGLKTEHGILDVFAAEAAFNENAPTSITAVFKGRGDVAGLHRLVERFNKFNTALNSHGGSITVSEEDAVKFDYEAELVIAIGRKARNVSEADALNHVFGYCTGNDFTARDLQSRTSQWMLGKSGDGYAPLGPWLVTADQVDGDNLKIECRVNGELRQSSSTADMVFNCRQLVSYCSKYMTLKPGDIIFTGTPEGVIAGKPKDKQVWLKAGDRIVTSIEKLGDLEFRLV